MLKLAHGVPWVKELSIMVVHCMKTAARATPRGCAASCKCGIEGGGRSWPALALAMHAADNTCMPIMTLPFTVSVLLKKGALSSHMVQHVRAWCIHFRPLPDFSRTNAFRNLVHVAHLKLWFKSVHALHHRA